MSLRRRFPAPGADASADPFAAGSGVCRGLQVVKLHSAAFSTLTIYESLWIKPCTWGVSGRKTVWRMRRSPRARKRSRCVLGVPMGLRVCVIFSICIGESDPFPAPYECLRRVHNNQWGMPGAQHVFRIAQSVKSLQGGENDVEGIAPP